MYIDRTTGEVFASSEALARGETIDLTTVAPYSYVVVCWDEETNEARWDRAFGSRLQDAIDEYNRWAKHKEHLDG